MLLTLCHNLIRTVNVFNLKVLVSVFVLQFDRSANNKGRLLGLGGNNIQATTPTKISKFKHNKIFYTVYKYKEDFKRLKLDLLLYLYCQWITIGVRRGIVGNKPLECLSSGQLLS